MKFNFNFVIPEVKADGQTLFPGVQCNVVVEHEKEEFLALLPHYQEMAKIVIPHIESLRSQTLVFIRSAAAAVGPEVLAMGKQLLDVWSEQQRMHIDQSKLDRETEREIRRRKELEELKVRGM